MPNTLKRVTLDELLDNEHNARSTIGDVEDLAESIVNTGLLEPLVAYKDGNQYRIIAGHRRRAAIALAVKNGLLPEDYLVDVVVRPKVTEEDQLAMMLVENMQRVDLPLIDQVRGIFALVSEHNWSQAKVAEQLGQSVKMVKQRAAWATLPEAMFDRFESGGLRIADLDTMVKLPSDVMSKLAAKKSLSTWDVDAAATAAKRVRETTAFVRKLSELTHIAVDVKAAKEMPAAAQAFLDALTAKHTQKVDAWDPKRFLEQAGAIVVPALLLVVPRNYQGYEISVVTEKADAAAWDTRAKHAGEKPEPESDLEIEQERVERARSAAFAAFHEQKDAARRDYVINSKPAALIAAVLMHRIRRLTSYLGASARELIIAVMDVPAATDEEILVFAAKNSSNMARVAAAIVMSEEATMLTPGLDVIERPDHDNFRVDWDRFDDHGRRLTDEQYEKLRAEIEADRADEE